MSKKASTKLPVDTALLLAVARHAGGDHCHKALNTVERYRMACYLGRRNEAKQAERELYAFLLERMESDGRIKKCGRMKKCFASLRRLIPHRKQGGVKGPELSALR